MLVNATIRANFLKRALENPRGLDATPAARIGSGQRGDRVNLQIGGKPVDFIDRVKLRRLIPAGVVALVIAFAYMAPLPAEASKTNNCGVKGGYAYGGYAFAFHDHGKPCPNRPFPGHGKGALRQLGIHLTTSESGGS